MLVLDTLAPVFLLIGIGALLQRSGFASPGFLKEANRLVYWLGLPALLFTELADSFHHAGGAKQMLACMALATALVILASYFVAWMLRLPSRSVGTFVQGSFRGNLAFIGLPVIFAMPDVTLPSGISSRTAAVVVVGPMMVAYNLVALVTLLLSQHTFGWKMVRPFLRQLATTPPLIATVAGIGFALAGWTLPTAVDKAFSALGEMALPLGLLGVGGSLAAVETGIIGRGSWGAAVMKTAVSPLLAWGVGRCLGMGGLELKTLTIFMATPTAVISYAMAVELKGDESMASGTIVLSVLLSVGALALVIAGMPG